MFYAGGARPRVPEQGAHEGPAARVAGRAQRLLWRLRAAAARAALLAAAPAHVLRLSCSPELHRGNAADSSPESRARMQFHGGFCCAAQLQRLGTTFWFSPGRGQCALRWMPAGAAAHASQQLCKQWRVLRVGYGPHNWVVILCDIACGMVWNSFRLAIAICAHRHLAHCPLGIPTLTSVNSQATF